MTDLVTTQRLLLSSADARVFEGKRGAESVFVTQVGKDAARKSVREWIKTSKPEGVSLTETDENLSVFTPANKGVRFDALASTNQLDVRDALALIVQATEVVQELLDDGDAPALSVRPWNLWLNANGRVSYETYGLPPALTAALEPGVATWADAYRTPAFLRGSAPNPTSDVFSLGATLAHLLTGLPAFDAGEQSATYDAIRRGEITPPSLQRAEITVDLEEVILRSVTSEQAERFDSPEHFGKALLEAGVGSVGVASRRDLRALSTAGAAAASTWLDAHPAPLGEDDPTLIVTRDEGTALDWGDDEETHVWGDEGEQEITDDDVLDPDAPATVVIARDEIRTTAPPIPAAASGASPVVESGQVPSLALGDEVTAQTEAAKSSAEPATERGAASASSAQVVSVGSARTPQRPIAAEDNKTTTQTRRPQSAVATNEEGGSLRGAMMLGIVLLGVAFVLLRPSCGATDDFSVQLALAPTDVEYRAFVDGTEVATGRPPLTLRGLTAGQHALRVEAEGYASHEQLLEVGPNTNPVLQAQLRPLVGAAEEPAADERETAAGLAADAPAEAGETPGSGEGSGQTVATGTNSARVPTNAQAPPNDNAAATRAVDEALAGTTPTTPTAADRAAATARRAESEARRQEEASATADRLRQQEAERAARLQREAAEQQARNSAGSSADDERAAAAEAAAREERRAAERAASERRATERAAAEAAEQRAATERAAVEAAPPASTEPGFLNVQSVPAARVFIDGQDTGRFTPMLNVPLPPGRHRVRLVNADFDLDRSYTITIESGRPRTVLNRQTP